MQVEIMREAGFDEALIGIALSFDRPCRTEEDRLAVYGTATKLCGKDGGHNKFLESMVVWIDITAPRYWWQQFDTYRVGTTKQSESTMHTILRRKMTEDDFEDILPDILEFLNYYIEKKDFTTVKNNLPESFLQRRIVCTNYKCLRNMILQRGKHKLSEWQYFISNIIASVEHPELLPVLVTEIK